METLAARFEPSSSRRWLAPVLAGGILAGAIDLAYAFVFYGAQGVAPTRILQGLILNCLMLNEETGVPKKQMPESVREVLEGRAVLPLAQP